MQLIPEEYISINILKMPEEDTNFRKIIIEYKGDRYNYVEGIK